MMFNDTSFMPVRFADLLVPPYQRRISNRLIVTILERWDPRMVRPLLVCSESRHIIDGNHTRVALQNKGFDSAMAQFVSCADLEEEMHVFNVANMTRKMLTGYDMHHAWLSINDLIAQKVQEIAEFQYGLQITRNRDEFGVLVSGHIPWVTIRRLIIEYPESYGVMLNKRVVPHKIHRRGSSAALFTELVLKAHAGDFRSTVTDSAA